MCITLFHIVEYSRNEIKPFATDGGSENIKRWWYAFWYTRGFY